MIGIGIDTGGTYTDAVVYETDKRKILSSAKALTTKHDLKIGIKNVLEKIPAEMLRKCASLALSTTLATNACVENKGGHGKLVYVGADKKIFENTYKNYGIDTLDDVYLLKCKLTNEPEKNEEPDWIGFERDMKAFLKRCDCVSVVQIYAKENLGSQEKKAGEIIKKIYDIPVILGHDLFPDRNVIRRGAGALLNARLIPVINEFLNSIETVFSKYGLDLPMVIVKSSGHLMSKEYTYTHPIETLLCGPAASIVGAQYLADYDNAVIVDMGGTTTDVAIIKNGKPLGTEDGVHIGSWKTFVKGLFVDTFALGGDSAVHYDINGNLFLENYRVIPLCVLAKEFPAIKDNLLKLKRFDRHNGIYLHEFLVLIKYPEETSEYTKDELELCNRLKKGPLILSDAAEIVSDYRYSSKTGKLEKEGVIIRAGLTPTDIMHICEDFTEFDKEASLIVCSFISKNINMSLEKLCSEIYDLVTKKLYKNLIRILIQNEYHDHDAKKLIDQIQGLFDFTYSHESSGLLDTHFFTKAKLISIGAPTHIFLKSVADLLQTEIIVPEYAAVANAIGAIVGNVVSTENAEIKPIYKENSITRYNVITHEINHSFDKYEEALEFAKTESRKAAKHQALKQGAKEPLDISLKIKRKEVTAGISNNILLWEIISATASGKNN